MLTPEQRDEILRIASRIEHASTEESEAYELANFHKYLDSITVPKGWLRAVDEEMVAAHLGVADASDDYATAKTKLNTLIAWHIEVATDPAVNGGWKLVPVMPTGAILDVLCDSGIGEYDDRLVDVYQTMLAAAPKPGENN